MPAGTLFIVATPIGNLADLSPRAQETLKTVAAICAEDTRHTRQLLSHFGIEQPADRPARTQRRGDVRASSSACSAAIRWHWSAMPARRWSAIPASGVVRAARAAGVRVSPIPGACAAIAALSVAGLPSDRFVFEGFLPAKSSARRERLGRLASETRTLVFYESSHRIAESLADMRTVFGDDRARGRSRAS